MICENEYYDEVKYCPIRNCGGWELIDIDENMNFVFRILNEKGFYTKSCCSSHLYYNKRHIYIVFYKEHYFEELPKGFSHGLLDIDGIQVSKIYKDFDELTKDKLQISIWKTLIDLLRWTVKLEPISNDVEDYKEFFFDRLNFTKGENTNSK